MQQRISGDLITVIIQFLPIDDRFRFCRINTTWFGAIQSLQNMWKDVLINFLHIDRIYCGGLNECMEEYKKSSVECCEEDWMKLAQHEFSILPRKIQSGSKILDSSHYGNVNLVRNWTSPFSLDTGNKFVINFPESISYYEFSYDLRKETGKSNKKLTNIYTTCLMYELLTLGDYVPNIAQDLVKVFPWMSNVSLHNFVRPVSFASVLLCTLQNDNRDKFQTWVEKEVMDTIRPNDIIYERGRNTIIRSSDITPDLVLDSLKTQGLSSIEFGPNIDIPSCEWLPLFKTFTNGLEIEKNHKARLNLASTFLFSLYYQDEISILSGRQSCDELTVFFNIEPNGRVVKLVRSESREYY